MGGSAYADSQNEGRLKPQTRSDTPLLTFQEGIHIRVIATREGLTGHLTATGWPIHDLVPFVALPSTRARWRAIRVTNLINDKSVEALVLDVGPHYTHDDAYVFEGQRPLAETTRPNKAGIDLGEYVWKALGMKDNGYVVWEFLK